jgi:hypothetical protein
MQLVEVKGKQQRRKKPLVRDGKMLLFSTTVFAVARKNSMRTRKGAMLMRVSRLDGSLFLYVDTEWMLTCLLMAERKDTPRERTLETFHFPDLTLRDRSGGASLPADDEK